ncbi:MAG: septum formation initiator family protein, partial [Bowdeniella nasicola]|nr:septum formation initiator family protein [Bowdeniella nasicola]
MRPPRPKRRHPQPPHAHVRRGQVPRRPPRQARRRRRTKVRRPARGLHITTARGSVSVSWRLVVFVTVVMLIVPSVLIPLTDYVQQREQVRALQAEVAEVKESIAGYEREKARWNNEAYVVSQARDRLGWVLPGETPYIVIDPH